MPTQTASSTRVEMHSSPHKAVTVNSGVSEDWNARLKEPAQCVPCTEPVPNFRGTHQAVFTLLGGASKLAACSCHSPRSPDSLEENELFRYIQDRFSGDEEIMDEITRHTLQKICKATVRSDANVQSWRHFGCDCGECFDCPHDSGNCECECGIPHIPPDEKGVDLQFLDRPVIDQAYDLVRAIPAKGSLEKWAAYSTAINNFKTWRQDGCSCKDCEHCSSAGEHPICSCTCGSPQKSVLPSGFNSDEHKKVNPDLLPEELRYLRNPVYNCVDGETCIVPSSFGTVSEKIEIVHQLQQCPDFYIESYLCIREGCACTATQFGLSGDFCSSQCRRGEPRVTNRLSQSPPVKCGGRCGRRDCEYASFTEEMVLKNHISKCQSKAKSKGRKRGSPQSRR